MGSHPPNVGHSSAKMAHKPYFRVFSQQMTPPPLHVQQDILLGGVGGELVAGFYVSSTRLHAQDWLGENG